VLEKRVECTADIGVARCTARCSNLGTQRVEHACHIAFGVESCYGRCLVSPALGRKHNWDGLTPISKWTRAHGRSMSMGSQRATAIGHAPRAERLQPPLHQKQWRQYGIDICSMYLNNTAYQIGTFTTMIDRPTAF
jgi:hypothetical protein